MDGWLITYKASSRTDITLINYFLFGRITTIVDKNGSKGKYYYPGLLENTKYYKLANGCYFTQEIIDDFDGRLALLGASIQISLSQMITAKEYWSNFIKEKKIQIKNKRL